ncbi:hypothetical protein N7495_002465 [Penicillium taxi]|uniref:uncharacterized protein n=1 Tax=Penicillium taxi TaxID=168475 RepID=UPI002545A186|nr:uncharacterized protein N7495_002465 [Penicillium taxi]KAJ5901937.1 hypothetical protein N7495_002465 [Penicillium taxi]
MSRYLPTNYYASNSESNWLNAITVQNRAFYDPRTYECHNTSLTPIIHRKLSERNVAWLPGIRSDPELVRKWADINFVIIRYEGTMLPVPYDDIATVEYEFECELYNGFVPEHHRSVSEYSEEEEYEDSCDYGNQLPPRYYSQDNLKRLQLSHQPAAKMQYHLHQTYPQTPKVVEFPTFQDSVIYTHSNITVSSTFLSEEELNIAAKQNMNYLFGTRNMEFNSFDEEFEALEALKT